MEVNIGNDPIHIRKWYVVHISDGFSEDIREENVIWKLSQVPDPDKMYSAIYSEKECYKAIEPFHGELYQTDLFQERNSQLNSIRTTSEENSRFVNYYREPLTIGKL